MVQIAKFLRTWFGLQALILISLTAFAVFLIARAFQAGMVGELLRQHREIIIAAMFSGAAVTGTAWWKLRKGQLSGRAWAMAASILNLPLFGLGTAVGLTGWAAVLCTVMGITGLAAFSRRDSVAKMAAAAAAERAARQPRMAGDGTSAWSDVVSVVGQVLLLIAGSSFWQSWARGVGMAEPPKYSWLLVYEFALLLCIACHEAGHVIAGWLTQMHLRQFIVGPFEWNRRGHRWSFRFQAKGLLGHGAAGMVPLHLKHLAGRSIFMTLGGPIGSLLIGSLAALVTLTAKGKFWEPGWEFFSVAATIGFGQFVVNLLPVMPESQYSDGAQIYQLVSRGPWGDIHMAFAMVSSTLVTAQRPRDYDIAVLERAAAFLEHGQKGILLRMYACFHYLDTGRKQDALNSLRSAEAIYPEVAALMAADQHAEFVFVNALYKRDRGRARLWWDLMQAKSDSKFRTDYWRARAAVYWVEGQMQEANEAWQKGNAMARSLPRAGAYDFDRWCFEELRRAMDGERPPSEDEAQGQASPGVSQQNDERDPATVLQLPQAVS